METPTSLLTFANHFPVYFRAPILLGLVWLLWGVNVWVFRAFHINYGELLNFDAGTMLSPKQIIVSGALFIGFVGVITLAFAYQFPFEDVLIFPSILYLSMAFCLVMPMNILHRPGRERLLHNLARVFFPASTGVLFVEVLLGDVLTSISKVIADVEVTGCVLAAHMVTPREVEQEFHDPHEMATSYSFHEAECADSWMRPLVTSIPFLLRFRQCWIQYRVTGKAFPNLVNCAKYMSSLPVIWISAFTQQEGHFSKELRAAWIFAVSFNSFFSFMWDIVMDWGLCRQGAKHFLLRERLVFETWSGAPIQAEGAGSGERTKTENDDDTNEFDKLVRQASNAVDGMKPGSSISGGYCVGSGYLVYYFAMVLNFVLRILWSFKLSVHFQLSQEGLTFVLEMCEVFRRFIWILFRVEWEAVERGGPALASATGSNGNKGMGVLVLEDNGGDIFRDKRSPKPVHGNARTRLDWGPAAGREDS